MWQVERLRRPCVQPPNEAWTRTTEKGYELQRECSFEIGDSSHTTVLYADSEREVRA